MILTLEREWRKFPGWFSTLERCQQVTLVAEYRLRMAPEKPVKASKHLETRNDPLRQKRAEFERFSSDFFSRGSR